MDSRPSPFKLAALCVLALAAAGAGLWWFRLHDYSLARSVEAGIDVLREAGPLAFFGAMALLPAVGCPVLLFSLTAGSAFSAQLGMPAVLLCCTAALAANMALTYWLTAAALRPWLERLVTRTKYRVPELKEADHAELTLILRITPGPPFFLQSYILGLARVRFFTYMWVSLVAIMPMVAGCVIFGDAILHGKARVAILGASALIGLSLIVHFVRRHYGKNRT
ncbi:MAG TPA: VTT domain-containing protein [Lacunisphaera sp.]|nr:VTT domain-containing protein [Lacunisphaera sp.]